MDSITGKLVVEEFRHYWELTNPRLNFTGKIGLCTDFTSSNYDPNDLPILSRIDKHITTESLHSQPWRNLR